MQGVRLAVVGKIALACSSPRLANLAHTLGLVQQEELQGGASHISCKHSRHLSCSCLGCHLCALRRFTSPPLLLAPTGALYYTMPHYKSRAVAPTLTSCWQAIHATHPNSMKLTQRRSTNQDNLEINATHTHVGAYPYSFNSNRRSVYVSNCANAIEVEATYST